MANTEKMLKRIIAFREARDWKQFHKPKDLAISLALEAAEVLEHFQWKSKEGEMEKYIKKYKKHIGEELSDVLYWILLLSNDLEIDLEKAFEKKMKKNERKYPIKKARGKDIKYNKL
jgi:NTP pyrophosphatase (non-canonical NTP hydrolase)